MALGKITQITPESGGKTLIIGGAGWSRSHIRLNHYSDPPRVGIGVESYTIVSYSYVRDTLFFPGRREVSLPAQYLGE